MSYTTSPNMFLRIPAVGNEAGPDYAIDINYDLLSIIDTHDHTVGKGVQITPAGLNINTTLSLNDNFIDEVSGVTFQAQSSVSTLGTIYEVGVDLYYTDGIGNVIRLTQSGGVAGTPGSISGLVSPASATYVPGSQTFVWQSNVGIAANMDAGSYIFRNLSPNSTFGITVQAPAALSSNYSLTLPALPASQKFMTLDASGNIAAPWSVDGTTIQIVANQLVAQPQNFSNTQREHAWELNGPYGSSNLTFPLLNIDSIFFAPYNITITAIWIYNGDAGSGGTTEYDIKKASPGGAFTTILSTTGKITSAAAANIWTDSNAVVAPQTGVTKPVVSVATVSAGQALKFDLVTSMTGTPSDARIRIIYQQV